MPEITDAEIEAVALGITEGTTPVDDGIRYLARAAILASRAALAEAGYKIVAREPTGAGCKRASDLYHSDGGSIADVWRAMWDAAP
jgi:hypothetical protein